MSAYVDDVLISTKSVTDLVNLNITTNDIYFGTGNSKWLGFLDDARIYNRTLSIDEIRAIYYQGNATVANPNVPTIQMTSPNPQSTITPDQTLKLESNANDLDGPISVVKYYANAVYIGESQVSPYTFNWTRMPAGNYTITAVATDYQGTTSNSQTIPITVNTFNFTNSINPTNEPISGGIGYSRVIDRAQATYIVSSPQDLLTRLSSATAGQIIYIDDNAIIDLTGLVSNTLNNGINVPTGVTIASGRGKNGSQGALIKSNDRFIQSNYVSIFRANANTRFTGLRFQGPAGEVSDESWQVLGTGNAIRTIAQNVEVDNCEFYDWDKWAIWLYIYNGANIHHNYFHDTLRNGYGYHIWLGGTSSETNANGMIEANIFERCRHCIASSGHLNSWEARYNIFTENNLYKNIDRHDSGTSGYGGKNTFFHHNLLMDMKNSVMGIAPPSPTSGGILNVYSNWFFEAGPNSDDFPNLTSPAQYPGTVQTSDFRYGFDGTFMPNAVINTNVTQGNAPLTVSFDGTPSSDKDGYKINRFTWFMGEGDSTRGIVKTDKQFNYTFNQPGKYRVKLMVQNEKGVPGFAFKDILVKPVNTQPKILSAWILDSYIGNLNGFFKKQVLVNNTVVWEEDVAGDQKWEHLILDITPQIPTGATNVRIAFRLASINATTNPTDQNTNICELRVWIDDIHLFGGNITNGNFESGDFTGWTNAYNGTWSAQIRAESTRSGKYSYCMRQGLFATRAANEYIEIFQNVTLTP